MGEEIQKQGFEIHTLRWTGELLFDCTIHTRRYKKYGNFLIEAAAGFMLHF